MKKLLIVDDADKYAKPLTDHFTQEGWVCERAYTAREGWEMYKATKYDMIISDITMETQTSGLWFIRRVHRDGFQGVKIIATTGFDAPGVMAISKWILPWFAGISYMIPKIPLVERGEVVKVPC